MNESNKIIAKENIELRTVGSEIDSLLRVLKRSKDGSFPLNKETENYLKAVIKDYCDTIIRCVDLL